MTKIDITPKIGCWGIWDKDGLAWIGTEAGPQTYADSVINGKMIPGQTLARLAATVLGRRAGPRHPFRFAAKQYTEEAKRKKDTVTWLKDAATALAELEAGAGP